MPVHKLVAISIAVVAALVQTGCVAPPAATRAGTAPPIAADLLDADPDAPEIALRSAASTRSAVGASPLVRGGPAVEAAAHRMLLDLRQAPGESGQRRLGAPALEMLRQEFERLRRHIAAAWQFDAGMAEASFMRVRLRATIGPDGTVRAIQLIDSHGGSEETLMRFVEDAISTLDGSSPLPIVDPAQQTRALVFRFETGAAPE